MTGRATGTRSVRFVATADWQLGMTAHFLDDDARPRFQQARFDAVRRIGAVAREHDAAFVVVGGDVFESNHLHRGVLARAFEAMRSIEVPVYLVAGNHDPLDAGSILRSEAFTQDCPEHVHVITDATPVPVVDGVEVVGAPWTSKRPLRDLMSAAVAELHPDPEVVRVLVGHGAADTLSPDANDPAVVVTARLTDAIRDGRIATAVLGDRHSVTEVAEGIWYPGAPEVTSRDEIDPGQVLVVDAGPEHCEITPVRVGRWRFDVLDHELTGAEDVTELERDLRGRTAKERTAIWLRLRGTLTLQEKAALDAVVDDAEQVYAAVTVWQRHHDLQVLPDATDLDALGLQGFAESAAAELAQTAAGTGDDAATARDALGLLYRLAGGAR